MTIQFFDLSVCILNVMGVILMGLDKYKAVRRYRRIPEVWLLLIGLLGGGFGSLLAMLLFRHKIRKDYFKIVFIAGCFLDLYIRLKYHLN